MFIGWRSRMYICGYIQWYFYAGICKTHQYDHNVGALYVLICDHRFLIHESSYAMSCVIDLFHACFGPFTCVFLLWLWCYFSWFLCLQVPTNSYSEIFEQSRGSTRDGTGVHDSIVNQLLTKVTWLPLDFFPIIDSFSVMISFVNYRNIVL